jgi:hypothetical protein
LREGWGLQTLSHFRFQVVAIAGLYRTGKSFILNQLAGQHDGFDLGATIEPCTQGIWLWSIEDGHLPGMPLMVPGATVILLDTEGLGSYTKTETYDIQVWTSQSLINVQCAANTTRFALRSFLCRFYFHHSLFITAWEASMRRR